MFPFSAFGSDGWAAATGLGSDWAPFMFLSHLLRRMGGPRPRGLGFHCSCSFLGLGRMGGPLFLSGSDGWAAATGLGSHWAPFISMQGLHVPFSAPGSDGWAAATGLGSRWAPFMFLSRLLDRWVGRGHGAGLYVPFSAPGSDGWAAATGLGLRWAPFMFLSRLGSGGWAAARSPERKCEGRPFLGAQPSCRGLPIRAEKGTEWPRPNPTQEPRKEHERSPVRAGTWVGWAGRGQEAALLLLGSLGLDGWAAAKKLGSLLPGWVG